MTSTSTATTILVLGATGKTGRRVLERLQAQGRPVRARSRGGDPQGEVALPVGGVREPFVDSARRAAATGVWEGGR